MKLSRILLSIGLVLIICSSFFSTILLIKSVNIDEPSNQIFVISNQYHVKRKQQITINFPFKWYWNYSKIQLKSIYNLQSSYYNMNQLLFNHSSIFNINWNIIKHISNLSLFNESNHHSLKINFFKLLADLSNNDGTIFSLNSIITWKLHNNYNNIYPNLFHCGSRFYPQTLYYHNGTSSISYLRVHNVLLINEPSLNLKDHNDLFLWIFVVNPYIHQHYTSNEYVKQSKYVSQLLEETKYVFCAFNFKYYGASKTVTILSQKIQRPLQFEDHYAIIKCKIPLAIYGYLDKMVKNKYIYTPFQIALFDPYQLLYAQSNQHNISYITVPICPNYVINNGMNIHSVYIDMNHTIYKQTALPTLNSLKSLKQSVDLIKNKKYNLGACIIIHEIKGDLYTLYDNNQIIQKIHEWIEFSIHIVGVEHFYFYHHIDIYENKRTFMWDKIINPYYKIYGDTFITYIKWKRPFNVQFMFQISAMNSCIRQFANDNKYLYMVDIDELFIPKELQWILSSSGLEMEFMTVYDIINHIDKTHPNTIIGEFGLDCDVGVTCIDQWGCNNDKNMFNTFIERHQCMVNSSDYIGDAHKVIVNPDLVEYQFVHYVDTYRILNHQYDDKQYESRKYLTLNNERNLYNFDLTKYVLCNHMKLNEEIFDRMQDVEHSDIMDGIIQYFKYQILNNSKIYNELYNINEVNVLPYIQLFSPHFCEYH